MSAGGPPRPDERTDLYESYRRFDSAVLAAVRARTFGEDFGQNGWLTADEHDRFLARLDLAPGATVLEVASGSGGPALRLAERASCRVVGIDADAAAVERARRTARDRGLAERADFRVADATARLPFDDAAFDALLCIDALNHLLDRPAVLREWRRVLRPGRRALFTDPVVVTGPVTNAELALRSSIGPFLFTPPDVNERLIAEAGLTLLHREDATANAALVAARWHAARAAHEPALVASEGPERYAGLQRFLASVELLSRERRLSRLAYLVERRG